MLSRALQISTPASLIRGFCASPQAAEVAKEVVEKAQTNERAQAAITLEELLKRVVGTSRVPGIVKERLLVIYLDSSKHSKRRKLLISLSKFFTRLSRQSLGRSWSHS